MSVFWLTIALVCAWLIVVLAIIGFFAFAAGNAPDLAVSEDEETSTAPTRRKPGD